MGSWKILALLFKNKTTVILKKSFGISLLKLIKKKKKLTPPAERRFRCSPPPLHWPEQKKKGKACLKDG